MTNLDVVIVNWNAGAHLKDCLDSLLISRPDPSFQLSKCILVDNASNDGSLEGVGSIPLPVVLERNTTNPGFGRASNQGAKRGRAEYILFLNPDIRLMPDSLSSALSFMQLPENSRIGILGIQLLDHSGAIQRNAARFPTAGSFLYQMIGLDRFLPSRFPPRVMTDWDHQFNRAVDTVQGAFLLVRREMFDAVGGFDERYFLYFEEVDLALRASRAGWSCFYLAEAQACHYGGGTTEGIKARRLFYWLRSRAQFTSLHFGQPGFFTILAASFLIEFWMRLLWNAIHFSWEHLRETLQAYGLYATAVPRLIRESHGTD